MRLVLAIVLSVTHLAGPWLCCCGPLAKAVAAPRQETTQNAPMTPPAEDECRHCCKKERAPEHEPTKQPPKAPKTPDRCPCCQVMAATMPAEQPKVQTADRLLVAVTVELPEPIAVVSVSASAATGLRELPHLTTADRLFAHHVLRC